MVYQHHRHNMHALVPVGDFLLQAAGWTGQPPTAFLSVFDGYSPVSSVVAPEIAPALDALRKDDDARALLLSGGEPADVLARLRERGARGGGVHRLGALPPARGLRPPEPHDRRAARAPARSPADRARRRSGRARAAVPTPPPPRSAPRCRRSTERRSTSCWPRPGSCTACATSGASTARSRRSGSSGSRCSSSVAVSSSDGRRGGRRRRPGGRRRRDRRPVRRRRGTHGGGAAGAGRRPRGAHPRRSPPAPRPAAARLRLPSTCSPRRWRG